MSTPTNPESESTKRKAVDEPETKPAKTPKRKASSQSRRTLGDTFGLVDDARWCLPQGTSAKIMQFVASSDTECREEDNSCPIDADEALIKVYTERARAKQSAIIDLIKRVFEENGERYTNFILQNNPSLIGRVNIVKALKGFEEAAFKMERISGTVAQAFEDAICENE